ncbi:MAG: MFS transporter [Campylobacteraceae bacterium]
MIFTRNFVLISFISFFITTAYYMLFVVCVPYAIERFSASPSISGLAAGSILIGSLIGRLVSGRIFNTFGWKKLILFGVLFYLINIFLYQHAGNLYIFIFIRFLSGIGIGFANTVAGTLVAYIIPKELYGQGINYFSLSSILAMAIGPFLGIYFLHVITFEQIYLFCFALGVFSFIFIFFIKYDDVESSKHKTGARYFSLESFIAKAAVPMAFVTMLISMGYGALQSFLSVYSKEIHLEAAAAIFFLVYACTAFISRPFSGKIFDKYGANIIIYPSLILTVIGFIMFSVSTTSTFFLLSSVLFGLGIANFQTSAQIVCMKLVDRTYFAQAITTYFVFVDMGIGVGPYMLGFLVPAFGYTGVFKVAALLVIICIPLYYIIYGKKSQG